MVVSLMSRSVWEASRRRGAAVLWLLLGACSGAATPKDAGAWRDARGDASSDAARPDAGAASDAAREAGSDASGDAAGSLGDAASPLRCPPRPDCAAVEHELPVPTHWSEVGRRVSFGAADAFTAFSDPGLRSDAYVPGRCYPVYTVVPPTVDAYVAALHTKVRIDDEVARSWALRACERVGVPIRHVRPVSTGRPASLRSGVCEVQVVHALVEEGALFTVLLPPGWRVDDPPGTHPILLWGFYDLHESVFDLYDGVPGGGWPDVLLEAVADSGRDGGRGVIGVVWNGGGALGSASLNPAFGRQVASIVQRVVRDYGGASQWVVTFGGSRGGVSALRTAVQGAASPFRVVLAIAAVPPTRFGEHAEMVSTTYPGLLGHRAWSVGYADAWREDWRYPSCGAHPELRGATAVEAHRYVLTGYRAEADADAVSLVSAASLDALRSEGTQIFLQIGEHDFIVPYAHQAEFAYKGLRAGLRMDVAVLLQSGHGALHEVGAPSMAKYGLLLRAAEVLSDPTLDLSGPVPSFVEAERTRYFVARRDMARHVEVSPSHFPVSVDVPAVAYRDSRLVVSVVAPPSSRYELFVTNPSGGRFRFLEGTLPADDPYEVHILHLAPDTPLGTWTWDARVTLPDGRLLVLPATATRTGAPCTTRLEASMPAVTGGAAQGLAAAPLPADEPFPGQGWGLSGYLE